MTRGICDVQAYLPSTRLARASIVEAHRWAQPARKASGTLATANWDEDSVTMARAACAGLADPAPALAFCSTTAPFADRSNAGLIRQSLDWPETTAVADHGGSLRAASSALLAQLAGNATDAVVVAADKRLAKPGSGQELGFADAAVAVRTGDDNVAAEYLGGVSHSRDFVDHYRASDQPFDYDFEARWVRDEGVQALVPGVIQSLLNELSLPGDSVKHLVANLPRRARASIACAAGLSAARLDSALDDAVGDSGTAASLLALAETMELAAVDDIVIVVTFGQGVDVLVLRVLQTLDSGIRRGLAAGRHADNYLRFLSLRGLLELDWGKRAERDVRTAQSSYYRERDQISAFVGGQCPHCGTVQFPRTKACVNPACRRLGEQRPYSLADATGTVKSFTEDWQAYSPDPPLIYGNVSFAGDANVLMQFTDTGSGEVAVGAAVTPEFRIKDIDHQRAYRRYFWKATLAGAAD